MKNFVTTVLIIICSVSTVFAQNTPEHFIETSVNVSRDVTPDEIVISFEIDEEDYKGKVSVQQKETLMINALKKLGIDTDKALTIRDINSNLKDNTLKKDQIFVSRNYMLEVSSAAVVTQVFGVLNNLEITRVNIARTSISSKLAEEIKSQLLVEAAKKARTNAQLMAQALDRNVGEVIYINNHYSYSSYDGAPELVLALAKSNRSASPVPSNPTELKISKQKLSVSINCKFAFK